MHALPAAQRDVSRRQLELLEVSQRVPLSQERLAGALLQGGMPCSRYVSAGFASNSICGVHCLPHPAGAWATSQGLDR